MSIAVKFVLSISILLIVSGSFFRIQHWPLWIEMIVSGFSLLFVAVILRFLKKSKKSTFDLLELTMLSFFAIHGIWTTLKLPSLELVRFALLLFGSLYFVGYVWIRWKGRSSKSIWTFSNVVYSISAVLIITGAIFKIQHWPGATFLLFGGLACACFYILKGLISRDKS